MPPEYSPTGGRSGWLPPSSSPTLAEPSPYVAATRASSLRSTATSWPGDRDARRMLEGGKLARKIGGNPALAQFELEIMPGAAVEDDELADVIASNLASQATQPRRRRWAVPQDPVGGRGLAWRPKGIDALRAADASIMPVAPKLATN